MFLRLFILLILLTCNIVGIAQSSFSISGIVKDESSNPIQYSAILILNQTDSTIINSCITDHDGKYCLSINRVGNYILKSQMAGYHSFCRNITIPKDSIYNITLQDDVKVLNEVMIIADRLKHEKDKYTINITNSPLTQGKNIIGVIKYLPGITKLEDDLYINGEKVSEIYIDNRKVVDIVELDAIQASNILKIEVIPNSGVKSRADKSKGIIKISLKENKNSGYFGNFGSLITFGKKQHSERITFPLSYKKGKMNIYNYIRINNINEPYLTEINTSYKQMNKNINTSTSNRYKGKILSDVFSLVFDIDESQNIGISFNTIQKKNKENIHSFSNIIGNKEYSSNYLLYGDRRTKQYQSALNYNIELDKKGSAIHLIGDYLKNKTDYNDNRRELYSSYFINDTLFNQTKTKSEQMKIQLDVDLRHWKNINLSFGGEISANETSNDIRYSRKNGTESEALNNLCDDFRYRGKGIGIYADLERNIGRLTIKSACRLQKDKYDLSSYGWEINKQNFLNFFPEFSLTYIFNENKNLYTQLYAKRGMDAIRYSDMNPIRVYASDVYYEKGNPKLEPVKWFSCGANIRLNQYLYFKYRYKVSKEDVAPITFVEDVEKGITYRMPENTGDSYSHLVNVNYSRTLAQWLTFNATLQGYITSLKNKEYSKNTKHLFFLISNDIRFSSDCGVEISIFTEKGMQILDTYYHSIYNLDWRFYTYFFNKRLVCSINGNNVLYRNRILTVNNGIYNRCEKNTSRRDFAAISLVWKFNSIEKIRTKRTKEILMMQSTTIGGR